MTTMEDLTKTQIVLLTLLVSFIVSIATGIITSSLLAQAPQAVTQTIERVVEQTVEQVSPSTTTSGATVKETTVVSEDDAVQNSIASALPSIVRISAPDSAGASFYGLGAIVSKSGIVVTDEHGVIASDIYSVTLSDGSTLPASVVAVSNSGNMALFKINLDSAHSAGLTAISFSKSALKLGQTVIAIEGKSTNAIDVGRATSIDQNAGKVTTDITPAGEVQGGPLLDLSGDLVGLKTSNADLTLPASVYTDAGSLGTFISAHS
jgi:S1-C subfamily serine protease